MTNKYLEKIAAAGFKFPSSTAGVAKVPVKKPVAPGLMKEAGIKSWFSRTPKPPTPFQVVRDTYLKPAGNALKKHVGEPVKGFLDVAAGAKVNDYAMKNLPTQAAKDAFQDIDNATTFAKKREVFSKNLGHLPPDRQSDILKNFDRERLKQNVARGTLAAGTLAAGTAATNSYRKRKALEQEALAYYQSQGLTL